MRAATALALAVGVAGAIAPMAACVSDVVPRNGEERAACKRDGSCDPGLECWSDRCVRPPPADCRAVAERLASVSLGNYASREEREPRVAELVRMCEAEQLSKREGRCLLEAGTEDELAACPRPLLPELRGDVEGCAALGAHAAELVAGGSGKNEELAALAGVTGRVKDTVSALCVSGRWAAGAKRCLMEARDLDGAEQCMDELDDDDRRMLDAQMQALMASVRRGGGGGGLPAECARYVRMMEAYAGCEKLPAEARKAIADGVRTMKQSWAGLEGGDRKEVARACRQGADGVAQGMSALGCPLPEPLREIDPWE